MEGWKRLQYIMESEGYNKNSFSTTIGINNNVTITRIINEKRNPSRATCQKIINRFPKYNFEWLHSGRGEMINDNKTVSIKVKKEEGRDKDYTNIPFIPNANRLESTGFINVPLVHVRAQCGYLNGFGDEGYIETLPSLPVIVDRTYHGKYMLFEAEGDSMDNGSKDSICDGDIVLAREVNRDLWRYRLHIKDWYFIIVHRTEGIAIKKIVDHDVEHGTITCHSLNDMFRDYKVNLDEVAELYNLIKIVDRSARL